jgi:hypothetical protein
MGLEPDPRPGRPRRLPRASGAAAIRRNFRECAFILDSRYTRKRKVDAGRRGQISVWYQAFPPLQAAPAVAVGRNLVIFHASKKSSGPSFETAMGARYEAVGPHIPGFARQAIFAATLSGRRNCFSLDARGGKVARAIHLHAGVAAPGSRIARGRWTLNMNSGRASWDEAFDVPRPST